MDTKDLVYMMFNSAPIEEFEKLFEADNTNLDWSQLLNMCYGEESYESVGGDYGNEDDPPINHEKLEYLAKLIDYLESRGITVK